MIQLTGAGKRFGEKLLFADLNCMITPRDRIGVVGGNGTGKTTLLKILAALEPLDYGARSAMKGITAGYLPQEGLALSGRTVFEECLAVFDSLRSMEGEMESLTRALAELDHEGPEYRQAADRFHQLDTQFRARDGYALEAQVGAVLSGLGFARRDWDRRTEEFSGGWQMRIALARLLLEKPNLLLLDEPTNHLDIEARDWLEQYLDSYPHAFVLISHDRYFLDVTAGRILEIWNRAVHFYAGNYSRYLVQKAERLAQLEAAWRNQQDRIQQLEAFISRFRYQATKARQVQSRIKELEKVDRIELPSQEKPVHFRFPQPKSSGRIVAELTHAAKSYGEHTVFDGLSLIIERGQRIALVGPNGAGKSTLIRMLAGIEPLTGGACRLGHNVALEYFAQDQYKELDPDARLLEDIGALAPRATQTELRSLLGCFLFSAEEVFKRVRVLSGGERNRYALARMLLRPANFLLLDEPTNHLDMRAKDVLLGALEDYTGTLVFVSHDRYFIDRLATRVFEVGGGAVVVHPGNYEDYLFSKSGAAPPLAPSVERAPPTAPAGVALPTRRVNPIRLRQLRQRQSEIEKKVAGAESEIADLERELAVFRSAEETRRISERLLQCRSAAAKLLHEWETVSQSLGSSSES